MEKMGELRMPLAKCVVKGFMAVLSDLLKLSLSRLCRDLRRVPLRADSPYR